MPQKLILKSKKAVINDISMIVTLLLVAVFLSCLNDPVVMKPDMDKAEFESVWQYLKTYSIYQDSSLYKGRILDNPFLYESPESMLYLVADTLKEGRYTHYIDESDLQEYGAISGLSNSTPDVFFSNLTELTGILTITTFMGTDIYRQFLGCVSKIPPSCKNLIIDLKGNRGGSIPEVDSIIEAFLPIGKEYIKARERNLEYGSESATKEWHSWFTGRAAHPALINKNLVVWMDEWTASASEILAAALKDCASARLVGSHSYGKGIGQIILKRNKRQWLQITFLQLRGVSERVGCYHGTGITPDFGIDDQTSIVRLFEPSYQGKYNNTKPSVYKMTAPACYRIIDEDSITSR